jgi:hypothetical protein
LEQSNHTAVAIDNEKRIMHSSGGTVQSDLQGLRLMNILSDREEAIPLYRQIVRQAREMILTTQLPPGFRLPPECRLAALLGVTRTTVTNAE